jgi:NADP-dependent 3-hydroxy acid dehydrogenase YdfG
MSASSCIPDGFAIEQPDDVDINEILFRPTRQEL